MAPGARMTRKIVKRSIFCKFFIFCLEKVQRGTDYSDFVQPVMGRTGSREPVLGMSG